LDAYSVVRACATSLQAMTSAADAIALGEIDLAVVGGRSDERRSDHLLAARRAGGGGGEPGPVAVEKLHAFQGVSARDLLPVPPPSRVLDGALDGRVRREDGQGERHLPRGAGRVGAPVALSRRPGLGRRQVPPRGDARLDRKNFDTVVAEDNVVRKDSKLEGYGKLKPVFDKKYGSITAGTPRP